MTGCAEQEGATAADIEESQAMKMPSTNTAKCMHACIGETIGAVCLSWFLNIFKETSIFLIILFL